MLIKQEINNIQKNLCDTGDTFWEIFNALGDCVRYRITKVLLRHDQICVTDLARICQVTVAAISQHLRILERCRLVNKQRVGKLVFYRLNTKIPEVKKIIAIVEGHLQQANI